MHSNDMTRGSIRGHLLRYAIPLVLGNLFQLSYNLFDSVIVGRFIGEDALAAESVASPVMNLLILGVSGLSMGAGVLMSEFFGARDGQRLKRELSTVLLFGVGFSLAAVALGVAFTGPLLRLLQVPEEIFFMTRLYLRIIFLGVPFTYFYNTLASGLKSVGDSKTPLKFLMFSSLLNAGLDVWLIGFLGFGMVCSATTTVLAQAVSALLCAAYIRQRVPELSLGRGELRMDKPLLKQTLQYGAITALQQSCQPIGKLMIQGCVNTLGVNVMAAFGAVTRVDDFAFTPEQSISHSITTFVAQNRGHAEKDPSAPRERIHQGFFTGLGLEAAYWVIICTITLLLRKPIMSLFVEPGTAPEVIDLGAAYLGLMAFFYVFPAFTNGIQGYFRGMGRMRVTLLGTFIQTSIRVVGTFLLAPRMGIQGIAYACALGWTAMLLFEFPYYFFLRKKNTSNMEENANHLRLDR